MPTLKLTQAAVERLKPPPKGRVEYFDAQLPAFGLRVSARGRKSWIALYRVGGKPVRETIGTLVTIPKVEVARERARESMRKAQTGVNPVKARRANAGAHRADTFSEVAELFLNRYARPNTRDTTYAETARVIERDVKPVWGNWPVGDIVKRDVLALLDAIVDRGAPIHANRTHAVIRRLFNWLVEREIIDRSPVFGLPMPSAENQRDRVLPDQEIRLFWHACEQIGWPFGPLYQLLLVTAQRRGEASQLEWPQFDLEKAVWHIPAKIAKNGRAHDVHLSGLALDIVGRLPRIDPPQGRTNHAYVFTTTGVTTVSGYSNAKDRVHDFMLAGLQRQFEGAGRNPAEAVIERWTLHDLRRTAATGMAGQGIAPHVVDRVLNHVSGTIKGVAAVYNRFAYLEERKAALAMWGRHIEGLVRRVASAH